MNCILSLYLEDLKIFTIDIFKKENDNFPLEKISEVQMPHSFDNRPQLHHFDLYKE